MPSRTEREIKAKILSALLERLDLTDDAQRLRHLANERIAAQQNRSPLSTYAALWPLIGTMADTIIPHATAGEMWWSHTVFFYVSSQAALWVDPDGDHVAAKFDLDDGDLHKYWIRIVAYFVLDEDRMPPGGRPYVSNPLSEVLGSVYGFTLPNDLFNFGDNWSKCWLNMKQTVFAIPKLDPGVMWNATLGLTAKESRTLVFNEDGYPEHVALPGLVSMPPVKFLMPAEPQAVNIELEWEFEVQLEGASGLWLGHSEQAPSCVIRHPQWFIQEA